VWPPRIGFSFPAFVKEYRNAGCTAQFFGLDSHAAFIETAVAGTGWDTLDGMILAIPTGWETDDTEPVNLAKQVHKEYHAESEWDRLKWDGSSLIGAFLNWYGIFQIIQETVERVGPENFTAQAFYDTAIQFSADIGGNTYSYTETDRTNWDYQGIYEIRAAEENIFRKDPEWQPKVTIEWW
jgi:hypothetical protein